ncbi:MAG: hypothetical protein IJE19_02880 [Clostridia bacterium]|nr:hypothetical protein [Clostridia bacterium]
MEFFENLYNVYAGMVESIYSDLFFWVVNTSISASFLVAAIIVLRLVLKKAPKAVFVVLWGLVALRLVCPFTLESAFSLIPSAETIPTEQFMYQYEQHDDYNLAIVDNPIYPEAITYYAGSVGSAGFRSVVYYLVWLGGIGAMLIYTVISYIIVRRKVKISAPLRENIRLCDGIKTPFILGIFKPKIYIPSDMNESDTELVIAHEKAHLKRRDHLWKPLGFLLLSFHWFNPVMWAAYILLCRDIELACDEKVIKNLGETIKKSYSEALLNCSVPRKMIAACPLAFGEVGVKQRIKSVLNYKKPAFWIIIIAVIASVAVAVCFMTNPEASSIDEVYGGIFENNYRITVVSGEKSYNISSQTAIDSTVDFLEEIKIGKAPIDDSRSEERAADYKIILYENKDNPEIYTVLNFNEDLDEMWINDSVKPSKTYKVKNPLRVRQIFDSATEKYLSDGFGNTDVRWDYMPMLSFSGYYYFPIGVDLDYDSVKVRCSAGELVDCDVAYPEEKLKGKELEYDKGRNIYWCPVSGEEEAAAEATVELWIYKDFKTIHEAVIKIVREDMTDAIWYASYAASMTSESEIVMVQEETGGKIIPLNKFTQSQPAISYLSEENYEEAAKRFGTETIRFFDAQIFGEEIFVGCEYDNKLGAAIFTKSKNGYKFKDAVMQYSFIDRGKDVYFVPFTSSDGGSLYFILSANSELAKINFTGDYEKNILVNHSPAFIVVDMTEEFNNRIPAGDNGSTEFTFSYEFYDRTGNLLGDAVRPTVTIDPLTEAIKKAVISHHKDVKPGGLFCCVSVYYFDVKEFSGTPVEGEKHKRGYTADTLIRYAEFSLNGGMLKEVSGYSTPMRFNFEVDGSDEYTLMSFSEISKQEYEKLSENVHIDTVKMTRECYAQAVEYYKINTDAVVEKLLDKVAAAKINSENAVDYLNACPEEYDELIYYGDYTLRYIFSEFLKGGQTDMRGKIMRRIMDGLIGGEAIKYYAENGQEYFDRWKQNAIEHQNRTGRENMLKTSPKAAMMLDMM